MQVVGITGYAQHGKDTLGARLVERYGFKRYAFADGLREMALAVDPFVRGEGNVFERLSEYVAGVGGWEAAKWNPEVRRLLQVIGTEGVRDIVGEDSWVRALGRKVERDKAERVVVTDVRFPNEAEWIHEQGGIVIRVQRVNPDGTAFDNGTGANGVHASEANVALMPWDVFLVNVGTSEYLDHIDGLMTHLADEAENVRNVLAFPQVLRNAEAWREGLIEVTAHGDAEPSYITTAYEVEAQSYRRTVMEEEHVDAMREHYR